MRNPFRAARDRFRHMNTELVTMRNGIPWTGFLVIIFVGLVAVIAIIYAVVVEYSHHCTNPIDTDNERVQRRDVLSMNNMGVTTPMKLNDLHAISIITTETVFSTSIVRVTPHPTKTISYTNSKPTTHSSTADESTSTAFNAPTISLTIPIDITTEKGFCPVTDRPHNVYTPCTYTSTVSPGAVNATAFSSSGVATSASRRRALNPMACRLRRGPENAYREDLGNFFAAVYELSWRVPRLIKVLALQAREVVADFIHPDPDSLAKLERDMGCLGFHDNRKQLHNRIRDLVDRNSRLQNSIRNTQEQLHSRVNRLEDKIRRLKVGVHNAQEVMQMQQDLLDSHLKVIERQQAQIQETTCFKVQRA